MNRHQVAQILLDDLMKGPSAGGAHGCTFKFMPKHLDNVCISGHVNLLALADAVLAAQQDGAWRPIETAAKDAPFWISDCGTRHFRAVLVVGPTWTGGWRDHPSEGGDFWTGPVKVTIADSYEGAGYWAVESSGPSDYEQYIRPTHWMPLPEPPRVEQGEKP